MKIQIRQGVVFPALAWVCFLFGVCVSAQAEEFQTEKLTKKGTRATSRSVSRGGRTVERSYSETDMVAVLSSSIKNLAHEALVRYLPVSEFQISVQVKPNGKPIPLTPYDPSGAIWGRSAQELSPYIERVSIQVLLTTRLKPSQMRLRQILTSELALNLKRGDRLSFGSLGIDIGPESWRQEKADLKTENDKLSRELSRSQTQEGFLGKYTKWTIGAVLLGFFGIILIGLFFAARSVMNLGRNLGTSVTAMATAVESVGSSIQAAAGISTGNTSMPGTLEAKMITEGGGRGGGGLANLPMESLHAHFIKLRQEILENVNEGSEAVILRHLTNLLSNPTTVSRAVVTMELLGRDMATELFKRLGLSSQEALLRFMREGRYESSKVELMLEAGEEMKTKLLVESFDTARGRPSEKVAEKILQLGDGDLIMVANELSSELLPRLFLYLDSTKIALVLAALKKENAPSYSKTLAVLSKMPDAETANHHDQDILRTLDAVINKTRSDVQRPFLKIYQEIIEAAEEDLSEEIVQKLSEDPRLDQYFRENIITVHTFFRLTDEARNEIVESLSNKDVAALAYGVNEGEKKSLLQSLPARRKGLISEEFESLTSRGGRQAKYSYKRVRDSIVKKLKEMKVHGILSSALVKELIKEKSEEKVQSAFNAKGNANSASAVNRVGIPKGSIQGAVGKPEGSVGKVRGNVPSGIRPVDGGVSKQSSELRKMPPPPKKVA